MRSRYVCYIILSVSQFEAFTDTMIDLLPERCRSCQWAQLLVIVTAAFESTKAPPSKVINKIDERCPGECVENGEVTASEVPLTLEDVEKAEQQLIGFFADQKALDDCPHCSFIED